MNIRIKFRTASAVVPLLLASGISAAVAAEPPLAVTYLRTEYKTDPMGIDAPAPRLSWQITSDARGVRQTAYQVVVAREVGGSRETAVWDSGRVESDRQVHVAYAGAPLISSGRYRWRVRIWSGDGRASAWSALGHFEMGLLEPGDWKASWVGPSWDDNQERMRPAPLLRGSFELKAPVRSARAYVTALGLYELQLNGQRVGQDLFTPGWTSYKKRVQYQTYDVTSLLRPGQNALGATLGDGWYRGFLAWGDQRNTYGDRLALRCLIRVEYADGTVGVFGTDTGWKAARGPILHSDIYNGEAYDARQEKTGFGTIGFDDHDWMPVVEVTPPPAALVAPAGPPVRRTEERVPVRIFRTPGGDTVADLGQNMVGFVRLRVKGPAGTVVTLHHAEVLDKDGNFYTANLRRAKQEVSYTLKGGGDEVYEPHFTFQGFRYVAVSGFPGEVTPDALTGVVVHSDMPTTGEFETSSPLVNQLQKNIAWGQRGNFLDVPTDCPQRDERLGWTGDAQVFSRTAAFNRDVAGFFTKWLRDVAADQDQSGSVPFVVPDVLSRPGKFAGGSAAWADAAVIIPWQMYLAYGDTRILEVQYPSMKAWVEYMRGQAGESALWNTGFHFGDWLAFASTASDYPGATTGKDLIATAFFAYSTDLLQRTAQVLGKKEDVAEYRGLASRIRAAFQKEFVTATGRVGENTQTAYVLALQFDLLPENLRALAANRLAAEVKARGHLTTGFVGTPYLCHVLSRTGHTDLAYLLLNREEYPSWLYPVKQGATTIWERWDGQKPDGSFQDVGMNSFNHYAYGAIGEWMYRVVAGLEIDPLYPGYKHVLVQPQPGGGLTKARASVQSLYGEVSSAWELSGDTMTYTVVLPANTNGTVRLPLTQSSAVSEGGKPVVSAPGVISVGDDGTDVVVEVGSGKYQFQTPVGELLDRLRPLPPTKP